MTHHIGTSNADKIEREEGMEYMLLWKPLPIHNRMWRCCTNGAACMKGRWVTGSRGIRMLVFAFAHILSQANTWLPTEQD